jgi:aryl-alcohol dehydrogenase-like predicted oxidoreductase
LIDYLEEKEVGIISASPLSMGLLTERGAPAWHPAPETIKAACAQAAEYCRNKGVDIAQLAVQFALSNPRITTTVVGTANPENLKKNVDWIATPLDHELLAKVQRILAPVHNQIWPSGRAENN